MLGMRIENLGLLSTNLIFSHCQMDFVSLSHLNLTGVQFEDCSLKEADFTEADLEGAEFINCDLHKALFYRTNLQGADFSSALRIQLDPEENSLRKARFSLEALPGLLVKYGIKIEGSS
jgi:fluoroquinolone resistance protein